MTRAKAKRTPARKRAAPRPKARTATIAPAVGHGVEYVPAAHGVELPPDFPASPFDAEVQAMLEGYFGNVTVHPEVLRLMAIAVRLRQAWQAAEARCIERQPPERRAGSAERLASFAYQQAMARLVHAARELAALPARH